MNHSICKQPIPLHPMPHRMRVEQEFITVQSTCEAKNAYQAGNSYEDNCNHIQRYKCTHFPPKGEPGRRTCPAAGLCGWRDGGAVSGELGAGDKACAARRADSAVRRLTDLTESAEPLDCHDGSAGVRVQSAEGSDGVDGLPDTWSERGWGFAMCWKMCTLATWN